MRRLTRLGFIFLAFYLVFIGGSVYFVFFFPIRIFHHIFITLLLSIWFISRVRSGGLPSTALNYPLYAAVVVWLITATFSTVPRLAFENIWLPIVHVAFFFALADLFQRGRQRMVFDTVFILSALVIFITGLDVASWWFGLGITPNTQIGWSQISLAPPSLPRVSLAMSVSTLLAGFTAPLVTLAFGWSLTTYRRDYRLTLRLLGILLLIVLLMTNSRGGVLSAASAIGTFLAIRLAQSPQIKQRVKPQYVLMVMTLAIFAIVGFLLWNTLRTPLRSGDVGRLDMWRSALEMASEHPLTGVGPGLFGREYRSYRSIEHIRDKLASAHSAPLNTLAETGILGAIVTVWLAGALLWGAWRTWQVMPSASRKMRVEICTAALIGIGIHSLVDVFTITPIVLLIITLAAYAVTGHRSQLDPRPKEGVWATYAGLVIVAAYGIWFVRLDQAQGRYQNSLALRDVSALSESQGAEAVDPYLSLYNLQTAYLSGLYSASEKAIEAYQTALEREPTWDLGWMNLAALYERQNNFEAALAALEQAIKINPFTPASFHWARIAEMLDYNDAEAILTAYSNALRSAPYLPLSLIWNETGLREEALLQYVDGLPLERAYRVLAVHQPETLSEIVPAHPQTAAEWWVVGEYARAIENDTQKAEQAFQEAIKLAPYYGDYYVSLAQVVMQHSPDEALELLNIAILVGVKDSYPNAIRADLAHTEEERRNYLAAALPPRSQPQEFAAVLYNRVAGFDLLPEVRWPGPGEAALKPWFTLATIYEEEGNREAAIRVYEAIKDYAPEITLP